MTAAAWLIVAAVLVLVALVTAIVLQQRRSDRPTDRPEAEALSAGQRQQDRGGWTA